MIMKRFLFLLTLTSCIACADKPKKESADLTEDIKIQSDTITKVDAPIQNIVYETSTFDDPKFAKQSLKIRNELKELDDAGVFDNAYSTLRANLSDRHFGFLKGLRKNYKLLYLASGSLFNSGNDDKAMVMYDPEEQCISILLYNSLLGDGGKLYRDYKVENGLKNAKCHYSNFGTLDYQLASEIVYMKESLIKDPKSLSENIVCLIANFTKDKNYAPEGGCFSTKTPKKPENALCIATSFVYNNWECLAYNKKTESFLIYYGQAFAD